MKNGEACPAGGAAPVKAKTSSGDDNPSLELAGVLLEFLGGRRKKEKRERKMVNLMMSSIAIAREENKVCGRERGRHQTA